ncbi:MAG: hypothetical protein IJF22_03115 [Clostridia bacterium]|nr:hypothetical protein [Clostridia bacterium]
MKSHKKGYTLATTLLIMVFVFGVSAVMVSLVAGQNSIAKKNALVFEEKLAITQICTNFVDMENLQFKDYYQGLGYSLTNYNGKTFLAYPQNPISIVTEENGYTQNLWVVKNNNVSVASVQKSFGQVVTFTYEEKEFEI